MNKINEKLACESATGCVQNGVIVYYDKDKNIISKKRASEILQDGENVVEVPAAGAGSYRDIFLNCGYEEIRVIDWTSSAGDWTFGVKNTDGWFVAWQENRYPYQGFRYGVSTASGNCDTFEQLCEMVEEGC
jgi:hypothetical protein